MTEERLCAKAENYLDTLCNKMSNRSVGRPANKKATDYFNKTIRTFGFQTEKQLFNCMEWYPSEVILKVDTKTFEAFTSPYTLGCALQAELVIVSTVSELEKVNARNKILLIRGALAKEQLMAKNFIFYNPEEHQYIYKQLELKAPGAIITATGKNPELAGSMYPFPMIEDGDFDIPSVYMKDVEGERLLDFMGHQVELQFDSKRIPSTGCNIVARKGNQFDKRIVVCAHIDAKENTPGALDNGTGIVVLMLLAELLNDYNQEWGVELLALNGEDYYAASGQMTYLQKMQNAFDAIGLVINIDGAGYYKEHSSISFYNLESKQKKITDMVSNYEIKPGQPWSQGDHMIFAMNGCPAIAFTSDILEISKTITHTPKDKPDLVDCQKLVEIAKTIKNIIYSIDTIDRL